MRRTDTLLHSLRVLTHVTSEYTNMPIEYANIQYRLQYMNDTVSRYLSHKFERTNLIRSYETKISSFLALIEILRNGKLVAYSTLRVTLNMVGRHFDAKLHYVIDTVSLTV